MANNVPKEPSGRKGYLIPPLPQAKLQTLPENESKARSPLGRSSNARSGPEFPFPDSSDQQKSSCSSSVSLIGTGSVKFQGPGSNVGKALDTNRGILVPNKPFSSITNRRSERKNVANVTLDKENGLPILPSSSRRLGVGPTKANNNRPVLRARETMESLFGLTSESSEEYRELSHRIADGRLSDNPAAWRRVLELARAQEGENKASSSSDGGPSNNNNQREFLSRLHQRAIIRLPLEKPTSNFAIVLQVWLAYARVKETVSRDDCRLTFQKIQRSGLAKKEASFYLALADFETRNNNLQGAREILQQATENNAQPRESIEKALRMLPRNSTSAVAETTRQNPRMANATRTNNATVSRKLESQRLSTPALSPRKRRAEPSVSPKRRKTERGAVEVMPTESLDEHGNRSAAEQNLPISLASPTERMTCSNIADTRVVNTITSNSQRPSDASNSSSISREKGDTKPIVHVASALALQVESTSAPEQINQSNAQPTPPTPLAPVQQAVSETKHTTDSKKHVQQVTFQNQRSSSKSAQKFGLLGREGGSALKRPPLSKTSRLTRKGISGSAQRVESGYSPAVDSDSDDSTTVNAQNYEETLTTITQKDVSYILDWEPGRSMNQTTQSATSDRKVSNHKEGDTKLSTTLLEESSNRSLEASTPHSHQRRTTEGKMLRPIEAKRPSVESTQKTAESTTSGRSDSSESSRSTSTSGSSNSSSSSHVSRSRLSESSARLVASSNPAFLPLVSESNIIKVNNVPYVKLGVVGKGGSSKVYRALTKDLNVVAIKKVKLNGMDQRTIDGYANEIDLLKRLRNNPSIIQMHDSEVATSRKAIYVVMEAGEADLNHALHQRTMTCRTHSGSAEKKTLDMNFIRLTWQQMLNAVHSIHEARIIHGDLKPANFLFVRGTLKLIDFGIAKAIQSEDTTNIYRDSHVGTLNYMSPEAILDSDAGKPGAPRMKCGRASDIWSLGCILYQMVYGRTPFAHLHMIQKLQAIIDTNHEINFPATVSEAAIDTMKQCLRRKPQHRPPIVGRNGLLNDHIFLNE